MTDYPIRQKSAHGKPAPRSRFTRLCEKCGADFLSLAAGKTGELGLWREWTWWCSIECAPDDVRKLAKRGSDGDA